MYSDTTLSWLPVTFFSLVVLVVGINTFLVKSHIWYTMNCLVLITLFSIWVLSNTLSVAKISKKLDDALNNDKFQFTSKTSTVVVLATDFYENNNKVDTTKKIVPGTHHSLSYKIKENDTLHFVEGGFMDLLINIPIIKNLVIVIAKTQTRTLEEQFKDGIRYFDIRVSHCTNSEGKNEMYVDHGVIFCTLDEFCDIFFKLLDKYLGETVYLNVAVSAYNKSEFDVTPKNYFSLKYNTYVKNRKLTTIASELAVGDLYLNTEKTIWPNSSSVTEIIPFINTAIENSNTPLLFIDAVCTIQTFDIFLFVIYILLLMGSVLSIVLGIRLYNSHHN